MSKPILLDGEILSTLNSNKIYNKNQIKKFSHFSRFGYFDPFNMNTVSKEYLFFTKMDLNLFQRNSQTLNPELANRPFFEMCRTNYIDTMNQLQLSTYRPNLSPFANLLTNTVKNNLDINDISIDELETAGNVDGIRMVYPLTTPKSNNLQNFTLEFEDNKFLDVYMFFRIWYEYEALKSKGLVRPDRNYIINRRLHDQMAVYKIIVGEDMSTIIHWSKLWGVYPTSIPRSVFGDLQDGQITIPVSFNAQWVQDMDPNILSDFNALSNKYYSKSSEIKLYDTEKQMINGKWCNMPYIDKSYLNNRRVYKLKWR